MSLNRRELLRRTAAAAMAVSLPRAALAAPPPPRIIDTHQHLLDLDKVRLPWLDRAGPLLKRNYLTADYLKAAEGLNVAKAVYMEVEVAPEQEGAEADYVIGLCERKEGPTVAAVIGGRPETEGFRPYITR